MPVAIFYGLGFEIRERTGFGVFFSTSIGIFFAFPLSINISFLQTGQCRRAARMISMTDITITLLRQ